LKEKQKMMSRDSSVHDEDDCGYSTESENTFDKTETLV
jgi:hypothetical protein